MSGPELFHSTPNSPAMESIPQVNDTPMPAAGSGASGTVPYEADDPDPLPGNATAAEKAAYADEVQAYCTNILDALKSTGFSGEALWIEYTATFRKHTILAMPKQIVQRWVAFLLFRGVHVTRKRFFPRAQALIECLLQDWFIPAAASAGSDSQLLGSRTEVREYETPRIQEVTHNHNIPAINTVQRKQQANLGHNEGDQRPSSTIPVSPDRQDNTHHRDTVDVGRTLNCVAAAPEQNDAVRGTPTQWNPSQIRKNSSNSNSLGINGLMRAYQGRHKFSGRCDDDLSSSFLLYETLSGVVVLRSKKRPKHFL